MESSKRGGHKIYKRAGRIMILSAVICHEKTHCKALQRNNIYVILMFLGPRGEGQVACSSPCDNKDINIY